jgi:hypothetical protein
MVGMDIVTIKNHDKIIALKARKERKRASEKRC